MMEILSPTTPTRTSSAYCLPAKKFSLASQTDMLSHSNNNELCTLSLNPEEPRPRLLLSSGVGTGGESIHHRRSKSLRERTGAENVCKLEQLGFSVDAVKSVHISPPMIWTVIPGTNTERTRPVRKSDFSEHLRLMAADKDLRFSQEFEDLRPVGKRQTYISADLTQNRAKNRFSNILPFDSTRVRLQQISGIHGSDYINANFIQGFNGPCEYIATQGPLASTRSDFWRVIWEQKSLSIVNLTRCIEKGKEKCDRYWPTELFVPETSGDLEITLLKEQVESEFTVREFYLVNKLDSTSPASQRLVKQFHFTTWPDFGVPERPNSLLRFIQAFRAQVSPLKANGPIVTHCCAGVGRSGTFIAIDKLLQAVESQDAVDIFGTIHEMRSQRMQMVQTEQQYICVHKCIQTAIENKNASISEEGEMAMEMDCMTIELAIPPAFATQT